MKIDRFHVMGQSTSAFHVARLAMEHTDQVKSMVIVDSATLSPPVGNLAERRGALFEGRPQSVRDAFKFSMQQLSFNKGHVTDEFVDAAAYMAGLPNGRKTDAAMRGPAGKRYEEIIKESAAEIRDWMKSGKYQIPTLLCWGKNDPSAILAAGLVLFDIVSDQNPRTRMLIVNKAGHFHYREHPDEFVRNVTNFITAA
jgi:2-hydroxy-6-oxonona-2,4-dienedioate hydrolase